MCGRFTLRTPAHRLAEAFGVRELPNLRPRYNIAPSQDVVAIRAADDGTRELVLLRWGLIPFWAEKPAFRAAFRRRRCLVAADGFYEWQNTDGGAKQPYFIRLADDAPFAIAGLWERWSAPDGAEVESCTLITTDANDLLKPIHHRMPVILAPAAHDAWLDPDEPPPAALESLLRPYPADEMVAYAIGRLVNDARTDEPACIAPLG